MENRLTTSTVNDLFANSDPILVWPKAVGIIKRINPNYNFNLAHSVFDDVMRLFRGEYPGYCPIKTPYHDLSHTLDVFLCTVRLVHGLHISGEQLDDDEITLAMIAALMHDIGYAQLHDGTETGTGAQYTQSHVRRGIEFAQHYLAEHNLAPAFITSLESILLCTDPGQAYPEIRFPNERARRLGHIVGTADLVGQMADRTYLEKLLFLYLEFKEANFGNYHNVHDILYQTRNFYEITRKKLDVQFEGTYTSLTSHFKDALGANINFYMESIEKNMDYLAKVISADEAEHLSMLKRGGVVEKVQHIAVPE